MYGFLRHRCAKKIMLKVSGEIKLRQKVAVDMSGRSTASTMIGQPVTMPVALAPVGMTGMQAPDGEIKAARAARAVANLEEAQALAAAKGELAGFILSARSAGLRLVLVITGKGRGDLGPLPTRSGALRHEVPHWLDLPPLSRMVLQVVPAHDRHGGGGAYYVWLRRLPQG